MIWLLFPQDTQYATSVTVESVKRKKSGIIQEQGMLPQECLHPSAFPWVFSLTVYPADFGFTSLHNHMDQLLQINLSSLFSLCLSRSPLSISPISM